MSKHIKAKALPKATFHVGRLTSEKRIQAFETIASVASSSKLLVGNTALAQAVTDLKKAADAAQSAVTQRDAARKALRNQEEVLVQQEEQLIGVAESFRANVDLVAKGDVALMTELGVAPPAARSAPAIPVAPTDLISKPGKAPGEVTLQWKRPKKAMSFLLQTSVDPPTDASWTPLAAVTQTRTTLKVVSGKRMWVRVASVGSLGQSEWTSPVAVNGS